MKNIPIKDVMTPISNYITVREDEILYNVFKQIENDKADQHHKTHRDVIVVNKGGDFVGKLTMMDVFRSLEPNYQKLFKTREDGVFTKEFYMQAIKDFNLWQTPIKDLCERGSHIKVSDIMHIPADNEFVQEDDSLEKALHQYVMGEHQPLIVKKQDAITGILRFEDLYNVVRESMLACPVSA